MKNLNFEEALEIILAKDDRFTENAYYFIREALDHTIKALAKPTEGPARHVSGQELLGGIRDFALREYGALTLTVLNKWGITTTQDFGDLVFNLVDEGILGKTEEDKREDFADGYDFEEAFAKPFLPRKKKKKSTSKKESSLE